MNRTDDVADQILMRWKTEHTALGLAIARLESDLARVAKGTGPVENLWESPPQDVTAPPFTTAPQHLKVIRATRAASGPAKPLHWTQRPENRAKVRRVMRKAAAARGKG